MQRGEDISGALREAVVNLEMAVKQFSKQFGIKCATMRENI